MRSEGRIMQLTRRGWRPGSSGQAMLETILMMPLMLLVVLNAVNFGYFYMVALNLTAATRSGVEYSILGSSSPGGPSLPAATSSTACPTCTVSYLAYQDINGGLNNSSASKVQVCSAVLGTTGSGSTKTVNCQVCPSSSGTCTSGSGTGVAPAADPEAPTFLLNRVDVSYTFQPLLPQALFGLTLLASPICTSSGGIVQCTFHRQVSMRVMGP